MPEVKKPLEPALLENKNVPVRMFSRTAMAYCAQHFHIHAEIMYVFDSFIDMTLEGREYRVNAGEAVVVFPNQIHGFLRNDNVKHLTVLISPDFIPEFSDIFLHFAPDSPMLKNLSENPRIIEYMDSMYSVIKADIQNRRLVVKGIMTAFLGEVLDGMKMHSVSQNVSVIQAILSYCMNHYREDITLRSISHDLYISPNYISRIFKNKLKIGFNDYVNYLRVKNSCSMLEETDYSMSQVAEDSGFSSVRTFNYVFRELMGQSPSEYRKAQKSPK